jgi:hypothetical protein
MQNIDRKEVFMLNDNYNDRNQQIVVVQENQALAAIMAFFFLESGN